jgi:Immunoglobulin-like domain of bacterial spore germination
MTRRWERELRTLKDVPAPLERIRERAARVPAGDASIDLPPRRQRIVAGVVAFAVFAVAGAFAWRAFEVDSAPVVSAPSNELPVLSVRLDGNVGPIDDGSDGDLRRVNTVFDYGDVHEESFTSTTPEGAIVEWISVEDLTVFTPGPATGSGVTISADGEDPRVLLGSPEDWPNFEQFERIDRLPSEPGDYMLVVEADYPEGTARTARRIHVVEPGALQLSLTEGGEPGAARATAYVDGSAVEGFLSTSMFMSGDVGTQTNPRPPDFGTEEPVVVAGGAPIFLTTPADTASAGLTKEYALAPDVLPIDLAGQTSTLSSPPGTYLLAVDATWKHGTVGWASSGTRETARFFFPVEVVGTSSEPPPAESPALDPIVVTSPAPGTEVTSPVTVAGTADVFEGTVTILIFDGTNNQIAETIATATCGSGCRGDFSVEVPYSVGGPQPGAIVVFEESAEDGTHQHTVRIPVTLTPGPQDPVAAEVEGQWFDEAGKALPDGSNGGPFVMSVYEGPDHCGMTSLSIASLAWPIGTSFTRPDEAGINNRQYIRDPQSLGWTSPTAPFDAGDKLPDDASFTGYQRGDWQLWVAPSDQNEAIYMVHGDPAAGGTWERWPRGRIGCD